MENKIFEELLDIFRADWLKKSTDEICEMFRGRVLDNNNCNVLKETFDNTLKFNVDALEEGLKVIERNYDILLKKRKERE